MDSEKNIIEIDIHLLDLRYANTRIKNPKELAKMQNSITSYGQIVPVLVVAENNHFILIDGYQRLEALKVSGHDCIKVQVVEENEANSLFILLARNNDRQWEAIEQASIIQELHNRFTYSFGEIAKRLGRDKSWVKRRLDLVDSLPDEIKQAVMNGQVSTWSASHVLVPLSRVNEEDAVRLTDKLLHNPLSTRELARLYGHYKKSNRVIRDRIIADPSLFAKAIQQQDQKQDAKQVNAGPEGKWLKDITIVCHILKRLINTADYVFYPEQDNLHRRQRQTWIKSAEKMIVELTERAGRKSHDNTGIPADNSGDGQ
ncbi:MAG: ParB/RepB/Spo0J family partition protein [Deltaproteobacteria bacterium]|nr:ParB/RepB/Spo0J family partition protein [Deltaproteobacteria bacterium]